MVGQLPEDVAVDRFRLGDPPALMQRHEHRQESLQPYTQITTLRSKVNCGELETGVDPTDFCRLLASNRKLLIAINICAPSSFGTIMGETYPKAQRTGVSHAATDRPINTSSSAQTWSSCGALPRFP